MKQEYASLVTITETEFEQSNDELYMRSLALLDPELWRIKTYLIHTRINPVIIPSIIEQLARVARGSGYGKVTIEIRERKAIKCEGLDSKLLNLDLEGV